MRIRGYTRNNQEILDCQDKIIPGGKRSVYIYGYFRSRYNKKLGPTTPYSDGGAPIPPDIMRSDSTHTGTYLPIRNPTFMRV